MAEGQPDRRVEELAGGRAAGNRGGMVAGQVGSGAGGQAGRRAGDQGAGGGSRQGTQQFLIKLDFLFREHTRTLHKNL